VGLDGRLIIPLIFGSTCPCFRTEEGVQVVGHFERDLDGELTEGQLLGTIHVGSIVYRRAVSASDHPLI